MTDPPISLTPHRLARRASAEAHVPPPPEIPLAGEAPPRLTAFIYYLLRDLVPPRYLDQIASHVQNVGYAELGELDKGLADYADRLARRLTFGYEPADEPE